MIYVIGDSHVSVFSGTDNGLDGKRHIQPEFGTCYTLRKGSLRVHNPFEQRIPYFCPIKIGSNTAYNSYDKLPIIEMALNEYEVSDTDYVFTCFGEIDIRNHIATNAVKTNITIFTSIKLCVDKYMKTILHLKNKGYNIGVYSPPASSINAGYKTEYGDVIIRNNMTIIFNNYLAERCLYNEVPVKDISKIMILEDGTTDTKFIMDDIHLSQEIMPHLKEAFKNEIEKTNN